MADQPNLFEEGTTQETPETTVGTTQANAYEEFLRNIKNEKGDQKYSSVEEALKGAGHAQDFISQLKQELAQKDAEREALQKEAARVAELEETLNKMMEAKNQGTPPPQELPDVEAIVQQTLARKEAEQTAARNQREVVDAFTSKYGSEAGSKFYSEAQALGFSQEAINGLAAQNPKAVLKLFNLDGGGAPKQLLQSPNRGSLNTSGMDAPAAFKIGKEETPLGLGATSGDLMDAYRRGGQMVDELARQGLDIEDLVNPKNYFKLFK